MKNRKRSYFLHGCPRPEIEFGDRADLKAKNWDHPNSSESDHYVFVLIWLGDVLALAPFYRVATNQLVRIKRAPFERMCNVCVRREKILLMKYTTQD